MKMTSLLFIASLAALTSGANAASSQLQAEPVVLPTYVVTAPRYLPVEQQINASLKELSQRATVPVAIAPELASLKAQATQHNPLAAAKLVPAAVRIAKS
jgi:hypothetical protein